MTTSRSQISNSSSSSSLTTSTAQPLSRSASSSPRICAAAPTSTPQVGCETISSLGSASISRPTMNFCRLPPERLLAAEPGAAGADEEAPDQRLGEGVDVADAQPPAAADGAGAREQRVLRQRERRHRAAAEPLLGHEVQAAAAAAARRVAGDVLVEQADRAPGARTSSPESARSSSCWPLPETPAMPTHLAGAHLEGDRLEARCRTGLPWRSERSCTASTTAPARASRCCSCGGSAPIIRRDRLALVSWVGSTSPVTLPPRSTVQWWQRLADLVELVPDVEDGAAFGGELRAA